MRIFDYTTQTRRLRRLVRSYQECNFVIDTAAMLLHDCVLRIGTIQNVLLYGCFSSSVLKAIHNNTMKYLVLANLIPELTAYNMKCNNAIELQSEYITCYREDKIPFRSSIFDLVLSNLTLQCVNELLLALVQYKTLLKPGGLFSACILGGETLQELRHAFIMADSEIYGGAFARIAPMISAESILKLMQHVGFKSTIVHNEAIEVQYADFQQLMRDARSLGYGILLLAKPLGLLTPRVLKYLEKAYKEKFYMDGAFKATYNIIVFSGFA